MNKFNKTHHFWQRAWERGINQSNIDCLLAELTPPKGKSLAVFGKQKLREAGIKLKNKSHLVIVMKGRVLITLFVVPDLYQFMKSNLMTNFIIL